MAMEFAKAFYHTTAWKQVRQEAMIRDHGLCQECLAKGIVRKASIVHHRIPLTPDNISDQSITLNLDNLECVCRACHSLVHGLASGGTRSGFAFDADGNLVEVTARKFIVVTGAPCSGKSTYIAAHQSEGEPVFKAGGLDSESAEIAKARRSFIKSWKVGEGIAWLEACTVTPTLKQDLRGCDWKEVRMYATEEVCIAHLEASSRDRQDEWREVIHRYYAP